MQGHRHAFTSHSATGWRFSDSCLSVDVAALDSSAGKITLQATEFDVMLRLPVSDRMSKPTHAAGRSYQP
jgi:hypothetical protein